MLKDSVTIEDPKGNVERRLAMYSRNDVLELKELEDLLAAPSPKPSEIVRNWPDAMWGIGMAKTEYPNGVVTYCSVGIIHETSGMEWGEPIVHKDGVKTWNRFDAAFVLGMESSQVAQLFRTNDAHGKEAAADYLESLGL